MVLALGKLALDEALVLLHVIAIGADEIGRLLHIAQGLQAILAHFQAVHRGNVEEPLADQRGHFAQQGNALRPGGGAPGREGGAGRLDRPVDVAGIAVLEVAHDHAGVDGAVGGIGALRGNPLAANVHLVRLAQAETGLRDGIFVVFVEQRIRAAQGGIGDFDVFAFGHGWDSFVLEQKTLNLVNQEWQIGLGEAQIRCWDPVMLNIGWNVLMVRISHRLTAG